MASPAKRLPTNVTGEFFVDSTCIDCGTCRWMAPESFSSDRSRGASRVHRQPNGGAERTAALGALVACPVAAIGTESKLDVRPAAKSFPRLVAENVFHCGFHSEKSFGAASYLIVRPEGNVLVDSPRWNGPLVQRIEELGGVATMFLTHRDDVAEHGRFQEHFGCTRVLHERDVEPETADVELRLHGDEPHLDGDLELIPTPGHTRGSACLLYRDRFLFTGDHVAFSLTRGEIYAFRSACWFDWETQIESMRKLTGRRFEHILPGHGAPCAFPAEEMRERMLRCVSWMQSVA